MDTVNVESLFNTTVGEVERLLSSKTVVGEPIKVNGSTIIPLVSVGFGFGVGGGAGHDKAKGGGGGSGGGGGIKPVGLIVVDEHGVRLDSVKGQASSIVETVADTIGTAMKAKSESKAD